MRSRNIRCGVRVIAVGIALTTGGAAAQAAPAGAADGSPPLDSLVARAIAVNPAIRAAADRVEAARAAIGPAGTRPDPMLRVGLVNFPVADPGFDQMMTMKTVGVGQLLPYPGKLGLRTRVAEYEAAAADARLEAVRRLVEQQVEDAYYELAFLDQAVEIIGRNQTLLVGFTRVTESRYGVGTGGQQDILKARVETARLAEQAATLVERRRAVLARLNAALDRRSDTPVEEPRVPERIAQAAIGPPSQIRFTSSALGARAADSPLPPLEALQERAVRENPELLAHDAATAAQAARLELARRDHLPDFDVSLQYGQRDGRSDFVSAVVSVPLPLQKGRKQDLRVKEATADLAALEAERAARANEIRAEVARDYADLERDRAQLALFVMSIIPQGRAALESATAGFQVGRVDFLTLLDNQATLYGYETAYHQALSDFARRLAELERTVGGEILP
ncbi:MAG: TolC family protein [Longimicrobiaceae bacterium]